MMIKNFVGDVRWHAQSGHAGDDGSPEVVDAPSANARQFIKTPLRVSKALKVFGPTGRKDMFAGLGPIADHVPGGFRQVDDVHLAVLGARSRNGPGPRVSVDLRPFKLRDLLTALPG